MGIETQIIPLVRQVIYTTYSAFPSAGLTIGDLAWATDRQCLYRWSGSAWESIGISSRHGNYADIGDPAHYPESSIYQADDQDLIYMVITAAWAPVTTAPGLPIWAAGNILVTSANTEQSSNSGTYVKKKEIQVASGGTIRVCFDLKNFSAGNMAYGRIYKNGVAFGTERSTTLSSYTTYSEDLAFSQNDLIQLYIKCDNQYAYIRNFQLKADKIHLHTVNQD